MSLSAISNANLYIKIYKLKLIIEMEQKKNYALPIAIMFALFFMISFVTGLQNPMGVIVKEQFGASNLMSQLGNFANFIAYAFMGIPAGLMLKNIGYRKTALAAVAVGFVGVGVQYASGAAGSFVIYLVGAFIAGFSMCMLNSVVNPMLNTLGGGGNTGNQLIQFGGSINSMGATIVPVLCGYLMGSQPTISDAAPALFLAMGIFALAFIVLYFVNIPEPFVVNEKKDKSDRHSALSFRHFILGAVGIFIYVGVEVGIPNIANLYMTRDAELGGLGISTAVAGAVVGTYWLLMLFGRLIGGVIGAKVSAKSMITFVSALGVILILLAMYLPKELMITMPAFENMSFVMAEVPVSILMFVLCGLCTSVMWGGIFNMAVEGLGKYTSMASGLFMVMVCGGGILPLLQGFIADNVNYVASYWVIIGGLAYIMLYALVGSKNVNKDIKVD